MQSMTGFARVEQTIDAYQYTIEVRSVNHRYLDLRFRLPPSLQAQEPVFAELARTRLQRGSLDVTIRQRLACEQKTAEGNTRFVVDEKAAASFFQACEWLHKNYHLPSAVPSLESLLASGKVLLTVEEVSDTGETLGPLKSLFAASLDQLVDQRTAEGQKTKSELLRLVEELRQIAGQYKPLAAAHPEDIRKRLTARIAQWKLTEVDAGRLEMEIAFYAGRSDISEEIQRFEAHLEAFSEQLDAPGPSGRRLDFLTQELHRETNTIASKVDDLRLSKLAVEAKTRIERLREQVQNVE